VQDGTDSYLDGLEPCPDCVGNGICPRCGEHSLDLGGSRNKCISCGWEEYESEGLGFNHFCMCGYSLTEVFE
jgi:ribosomal protein L37E